MNVSVRKNNTSSKGWKSFALGAATVAALLGSAACDPATPSASGHATPSGRTSTPASAGSAAPSTTAPTQPGSTAPATTAPATPAPATTAPAKPHSGASGTGGSSDGTDAYAACGKADLKVTATNQDPKGQPARHILLTATNIGKKTCNLYYYPYVTLGPAAGPVALFEEYPDAVTPLAPGKEAYSAMFVSGGQRDTFQATYINVNLQITKTGRRADEPIHVDMPAGVKSLEVDDGGRVTFWSPALGLVLRPVMSH
ncbi:DUF4232 domain-containing protein [Streptomyces cellulosae]|uniref:DUF4232 domain-containing protein n=1 Tax=Streptomyces cellulosae TaxID=1968 RepID=A0ABW7Y585_STRCE